MLKKISALMNFYILIDLYDQYQKDFFFKKAWIDLGHCIKEERPSSNDDYHVYVITS